MTIDIRDMLRSDYIGSDGNAGFIVSVGDVRIPAINAGASITAEQWRACYNARHWFN